MKTIFLFIALLFSYSINAQITKVSLQASGLTCSMCSNSINKALKTLTFVDNVDPNIETSTFEITFKQGSNIDFDAIKNKVEDAGFSVAAFVATINFENVQVEKNKPVTVGDKTFYFLNANEQSLTGLKKVRVIDKGFVSGKEYKKNASVILTSAKGTYYATI